MIDIENAKKEFDKYASQFNPNEGRIKLKIDHIKRVAEMSRVIATELNLNEEQIRLAEVIGLFHDIGRFKQAEIYDTFNDKQSVNHAEFSAKVLFEDNLIKNFKIEEKYYKVIKLAVLNHNKNKIDENLSEEELLYAKIIRDADKLDIFYTICEYDFPSIFWFQDFKCGKISDLIMKQLTEAHTINYADIKTNADQISIFYAYIYDFNFAYSLKYLKLKKYLEIFTDRVIENFNNKEVEMQVRKMLEISNNYLNITKTP